MIQAGAPPLDWHTDSDLGVGHIILSTQPYAGSHYATFPMDLPRKIIDCMCPRSVCRVCGVARERVVERGALENRVGRVDAAVWNPDLSKKSDEDHTASRWEHLVRDGFVPGHAYQTTTLGWTDCGHDNYRPGLTFDPFVGSGTTLAAAQDLGRDGIGIDIDEDNAWLARERVGMFCTFEHHDPPVVDVASDLL
jgi:hypothetical protein